MSKQKLITKQDLLDFGMIEDLENPIFPLSKTLSVEQGDDLQDEDDDDDFVSIEDDFIIALSLYKGNNQNQFVLNLPNGLVYLGITSIKDLEFIEKMVLEFEPYD